MQGALHSKLPVSQLFSSEYLEQYQILPLECADNKLLVASPSEPDDEILADLEETFGARTQILAVSSAELSDGIRRAYASAESVTSLVRDLASELVSDGILGEALADTRNLVNQPPVIRLVNLLIREAYEAGASDIHLEASDNGLRIRLRIDGVLSELPAPPTSLQAAVVSRLKLLAELNIAERRLPQDGRIRARLESRELDLRVSTVPSLHGESVVLRLLDRGGTPVTLDGLGMSAAPLEGMKRLSGRSHGIILATGPTGSGKTTTLYAALGLRNPSREKIITVEDPVEYHLAGITQVPIHEKVGVGFGSALRSILRQDPDVLMIGEMRDKETAAIAIQAAMTGHLVFSTLHTNDSVGALTRLVDLGVESYLIAATVDGVLAQRLVRKTCPDCRVEYQPDPAAVSLITGGASEADGQPPAFLRGTGCAACRGTGFRGRTGIFELLMITDELRAQLARTPNTTSLRALARDQGMQTIKQDGWSKVCAGVTTVEEVLRVAND